MERFKNFIISILPGIFIIGYNVGTGSISAMSKAGANFGIDLLWTVAISCLITYYLLLLFSRYTMVTHETVIQGFKNHISPALTGVLIFLLSLIIFSALSGVLGIMAEVLETSTEALFITKIDARWWAVFLAAIIYPVLYIGNFTLFEKVLTFLVSVMGLAFIATMLMHFPSLSEIVGGLIPGVPETATGSDNSPMVIVAGMTGTTVSVFALIIRSQLVKETGWKMKDDRVQKRDAIISASMMFVISAAVMVTAYATLHVKDLKLNHVSEMIWLMEPIAGSASVLVFLVGIVAAGLSSHLPNLLVIPWLIIDYRGSKRETRTAFYRALLLLLSLISLAGVLFNLKPMFIMLLSQASISIVLPLSLAGIYYLTSSKKLMNRHVNGMADHVILIAIILFACYMGSLGLKGVIMDLGS